jgi:hypothetical protein
MASIAAAKRLAVPQKAMVAATNFFIFISFLLD